MTSISGLVLAKLLNEFEIEERKRDKTVAKHQCYLKRVVAPAVLHLGLVHMNAQGNAKCKDAVGKHDKLRMLGEKIFCSQYGETAGHYVFLNTPK